MGLYCQLFNPRTRCSFELGRSPWQEPLQEFAVHGVGCGPWKLDQVRRQDLGATREEFIEIFVMGLCDRIPKLDQPKDAGQLYRELAGKLWDWMDDGVFWIGTDQTFNDVSLPFRFRVTASRYEVGTRIEEPPGPLPDHAEDRYDAMLLEELRKHV